MGRTRRLKVIGDEAYYHIISKTVGGMYLFGDLEKEKLLNIIKMFSKLYFVKVVGYCIMDNHFHLIIKSEPSDNYSDSEILSRLSDFNKRDKDVYKYQLERYRKKLEDISEFMKSVKLTFTRWYNGKNSRTGYLWGDRFKSILIESGEALLNTLAYVDLNPIRAGIVDKPELYRWSSIGYRVQYGNRDKFLSFEGVFDVDDNKALSLYRELVYRAGGIEKSGGKHIDSEELLKEIERDFELPSYEIFKYRMRYFSDGMVIGSKGFISDAYNKFGGVIIHKKDRNAHKTGITDNIYSIRCLS